MPEKQEGEVGLTQGTQYRQYEVDKTDFVDLTGLTEEQRVGIPIVGVSTDKEGNLPSHYESVSFIDGRYALKTGPNSKDITPEEALKLLKMKKNCLYSDRDFYS